MSSEAAEAVRKQRGWRFAYAKHLVRQVELSAESPENALAVARSGLKYMHSKFEFIRDGETMSLSDAMVSGAWAIVPCGRARVRV